MAKKYRWFDISTATYKTATLVDEQFARHLDRIGERVFPNPRRDASQDDPSHEQDTEDSYPGDDGRSYSKGKVRILKGTSQTRERDEPEVAARSISDRDIDDEREEPREPDRTAKRDRPPSHYHQRRSPPRLTLD